jgi:hypothetical protein
VGGGWGGVGGDTGPQLSQTGSERASAWHYPQLWVGRGVGEERAGVGVAAGAVGEGDEGREGGQLVGRWAIKWETKPVLIAQI